MEASLSIGKNATSSTGNTELTDSFNQAIKAASETLAISVTGQAHLNALRARPN
jgi:hypothetical protein